MPDQKTHEVVAQHGDSEHEPHHVRKPCQEDWNERRQEHPQAHEGNATE
jgi:hypothetical protein